ncbi:MAG: M55 family metallopeptidase [Gemmatimonadales bacterium]
MLRRPGALALLLGAVVATPAAAQRPIKVFISIDMEGITGVATDGQLGPGAFEWERFRAFMTAEALAAIEGAREAGATEFVVADSHGNMQNLLIDRFPDDVTIVRGSPRPWSMMEGLDSTFSAAMFIGYHAATTNPMGVRAHTISSATFAGVYLNGRAQSESSINAALAGSVGVPIVLVSGDDQAVSEVRTLLGEVEGAVVKRAIGFHSAATMTPAAGQALIKARARAAIQRLASFKPYRVAGPYAIDLVYKSYRPAEAMALLPGVERRDAHTIRFTARSIGDVSRFLVFSTTYRSDLEP